MRDENRPRDIYHEMADALRLLGNEYTTTNVECDPGDSAVRITNQNSGKTLYIIAYSNPDDTEIILYDENDELISQHDYYDDSFAELPAERFAAIINELL